MSYELVLDTSEVAETERFEVVTTSTSASTVHPRSLSRNTFADGGVYLVQRPILLLVPVVVMPSDNG